MNKKQVTEALSKHLTDMNDQDLVGILEVPETFWPTNPFNYTTKALVEEQQRRTIKSKIRYEDILKEVVYLSTLRQLVSFGPRVFPEMDSLGLDQAAEEIIRLQAIVNARIKKYKAQ